MMVVMVMTVRVTMALVTVILAMSEHTLKYKAVVAMPSNHDLDFRICMNSVRIIWHYLPLNLFNTLRTQKY
jgi:hypothetical protein